MKIGREKRRDAWAKTKVINDNIRVMYRSRTAHQIMDQSRGMLYVGHKTHQHSRSQ